MNGSISTYPQCSERLSAYVRKQTMTILLVSVKSRKDGVAAIFVVSRKSFNADNFTDLIKWLRCLKDSVRTAKKRVLMGSSKPKLKHMNNRPKKASGEAQRRAAGTVPTRS